MSHKIVYEKWTFPADKIREGNLYLATSLLSSSLEVNTLNATVECADPSILDFQRNAQLLYYAQPDRPMVFRVQNITRTAPSLYELSCTSTLGLLTEGQHMGGIYTGQTAQEIIADICGNVPFIVKTNLMDIKMYGWLPIASPRDSLSQVLFAIGAALKTDLDGVLRIAGLWDGISSTVDSDRMYTDSSVDYSAKITQVIVTEHQYVPGTEEKQLFEGTAQEGDIITFDEPMHDLTAEGISILDRGANWAKVSAGSGTLKGKTYIHNTRQISRNVQTANTPNVKTVNGATLVSLVNSHACAQRMAEYYKCWEMVDATVVYQGEQPGDRMDTFHPFDKTGVGACLESADITLSNTLKSTEKCLVGYVPPQKNNDLEYDHQEILTGTGTWMPPDGVTHIMAVLIGSGTDGENGEAGGSYSRENIEVLGQTVSGTISDGKITVPSVTARFSGSQGSKGGKGGIGGNGGKILTIEMDVSQNTSIQYQCGLGIQSIFGSYSSEYGSYSPNGYYDTVSGRTYARKGKDGSDGGDGGGSGQDGKSVGGASGGKIGNIKTINYEDSRPDSYSVSYNVKGSWSLFGGGGAGGMTFGLDGRVSNGTDGTGADGYYSQQGVSYVTTSTTDEIFGRVYANAGRAGGGGAYGQDGINYGDGGGGGAGGGGAGACGGDVITVSGSVNTTGTYKIRCKAVISMISSQRGGTGGLRGKGIEGCILLYYKSLLKIQSGRFVDKNGKQFLEKFTRRFIV